VPIRSTASPDFLWNSLLDRIRSGEDIAMAGNQLFRFVINFEDSGKDGNVVGLGIAPLTIIVDQLPLMTLSVVTFVLVVGVIIFLIVRRIIEYRLWDMLKMVWIVSATLVIMAVTGAVV
jgi:hypothetical protein